MRLDEWQKFIESQFLEETAPAPVPVKPAATPAANPQTTLLLDDEPITLPEGVEDVPDTALPATENIAATVVYVEPQIEGAPSLSQSSPVTTPRQSGFVVRSVIEPLVERPEPLPPVSPVPFETRLDLEPTIPVFADYLPSKSATPEILPTDPEPESERVSNLLENEHPSGPMSVLVPMTSGFTTAKSVPGPPPETDAESSPTAKRRKRAPQARNIQPESVPSGISSADLWSKVPRHVQTLLALERREEEREVAQSSYKRPFQEKRAELIARILDPILSLEDTARLLNVCPTTVRRYTNKGILTHYRKEPERPAANPSERETRQRRFRLSDILAFLETQQTALEADRLQERVAPSRRKRDEESPAAATRE